MSTKTKDPATAKADAVFQKYSGKKRFWVKPKGRAQILCAAPSEHAAIVAAAEYYNARWQDYEFYAFCDVFVAKAEKEAGA